jgi:Tetratricopeptide Repeats-Sensor
MPPKPLCFMIMPYGRKATQAEAGQGPAEIDFNALWDKAYVPVIDALGYQAVRADQDSGALIINQMLERLYFADLVLADMTIPNGNVYYEVGIRHAARKTGCVLLAADWSKQLFDVMQMRTVRYPLPEGEITEPTAAAFHAAVRNGIAGLADGESPMHAVLPGYPDAVDPAKASTMQGQMTALAEFQTKIRTVRVAPRNQRMQLAQQLIAADGSPPTTYSVALALSALLRDSARTSDDWKIVLAFLRGLPDKYRLTPELRELGAFAGSQAGNTTESIAELQTLIESFGPTPERLGLLGGRYKRLSNSDTLSAGEKAVALSQSIDAYERGMNLDLNQYYCSCNLPRLYRLRGDDGDEQCAQNIGQVVIAACERASPAAWQIESLLRDLEVSVRLVKDDATRARFVAVFERLRRLLA